MYKVMIIGHGDYPQGVFSALKLLVENTSNLIPFNLDESTTHEEFTKTIEEYLGNNDRVIIFADLTGGAPDQIAAQYLLESKKPHQYIVSGCSLNLILDVYVKVLENLVNDDNVEQILSHSIEESKNMINLLPNREESQEQNNLKDVEEGGI